LSLSLSRDRALSTERESSRICSSNVLLLCIVLKRALFCTPPNYPWIINAQRCPYFSSPPIQTTSSLIWDHFFLGTDYSRYEHITRGQDEAKITLNLYMPVEKNACATHPNSSASLRAAPSVMVMYKKLGAHVTFTSQSMQAYKVTGLGG